jgi:RNA polymerase sigma factor FliA
LTKNTDTPHEPTWAEALTDFDRSLAALGMAEKTRRAYGCDLDGLGRWAAERGIPPAHVGARDLRRYAAVLSERGASRATVARKLAAIRSFYRRQLERGMVDASPADLVASPKRDSRLPRVLKQREASALVDSVPTSEPLALRDRAVFELAYAAGLRAEELVNLDVTDLDRDAEELRVTGKGGRVRVIPAGEPAWPGPRGGGGPPRAGALSLEVGPAPLHLGRAAAAHEMGTPLWASARLSGGGLAARPASLVRDAPARRGRRPPLDTGAARPCHHQHHPDVHSGGSRPPAPAVRPRPPAGLTGRIGGGELPDGVKTVELNELWRRYKEDDDQAARERLVLAYSPLVKYVAGRMASGLPAHVEEGDLISYGLLGLISAVERFDPQREIKFETFAATRMKGAIIDELRSLDWVPRSVRARAREIEKVNARLEHQLLRAPTDQEMAEALDTSIEAFQATLTRIANSSVVALDELWTLSDASGDQVSLLDTIEDPGAPDPAEEMDSSDTKDRLADAVARLPEREKLVIALYYYENLTLREIGEVMGVTESRVSQLHTKAVLRLKSGLQPDVLEAAG